ncbi:zona pellucida sperm-binding protein 4-like isoform X2 [Hyperolius riggenbachi]
MTISLEEVLRNKDRRYHKKDFQCQNLPEMDAPSNQDCAAVQRTDRILCGNTSVSRDLCESVGCCFTSGDPVNPCYYGSKLTAQCADGNVVVVMSKDLVVPSLILDSVSVVGVDSSSCPSFSVTKTGSFVGFRFPVSCSAGRQASDNSVVYENNFEAAQVIQAWQSSSITRDSTMRLTVRCSYSDTGVAPLQVEVMTLPPPLPVSTTGPLNLEMRISPDGQYSRYYAAGDYPVVKVLRDPVFVEVRILNRNDPNLVLVLDNCWATGSDDPTDTIKWPILFNSCPFTGDNYLTEPIPVGTASQTVPFPNHYQRFVVSTFTFVGQSGQVSLNGLVFFHCSASVCVPSTTTSCRVSCGQRRRREADTMAKEFATASSHGPVIFNAEQEEISAVQDFSGANGGLGSSMSWLLGAAAVGCVGAVALVTINLIRRQSRSWSNNADLSPL